MCKVNIHGFDFELEDNDEVRISATECEQCNDSHINITIVRAGKVVVEVGDVRETRIEEDGILLEA